MLSADLSIARKNAIKAHPVFRNGQLYTSQRWRDKVVEAKVNKSRVKFDKGMLLL